MSSENGPRKEPSILPLPIDDVRPQPHLPVADAPVLQGEWALSDDEERPELEEEDCVRDQELHAEEAAEQKQKQNRPDQVDFTQFNEKQVKTARKMLTSDPSTIPDRFLVALTMEVPGMFIYVC